MTRFECFIQSLLLQKLQTNILDLNLAQQILLQHMIQEVYENEKIATFEIEQKVCYIADCYRAQFLSCQEVVS